MFTAILSMTPIVLLLGTLLGMWGWAVSRGPSGEK
jgi:hypothetical protein